MIIIKRLHTYSLAGVLCTLLPMTVVAKNNLQPIELRAQIGYADFDVENANLILTPGCERQPEACPKSQTSNNQDTAYGFLLTYNAWQNRYFNIALEGGYNNYGQAEYNAYYNQGTGKRTIDSMAWSVLLKGQYLLTQWVQPYIKLGAAHVKTHIKQNGLIDIRQPEVPVALDSNHTLYDTVPQLDIGVDFRFFDNHVIAYVNYTQLFGPGDTVDISGADEYLPLPSNTPEIGVIFAGIAIGFDPFKLGSRS